MLLQNPLGLLTLLIIPIFIILKLLRSKPTMLVVPSLLIWNKISPEPQQSRTHRRFTFVITFIIQIIALTLLSLAVSKPSVVIQKQYLPETVVILDNSIGMKTTLDNSLTRWDLAVTQFKKWLEKQPANSNILLIQTSGNNTTAISKKASEMPAYLDKLYPKETVINWTDWLAKFSPRLNQIDSNQEFYFYSDRPLPEEILKTLKVKPRQLLFGGKSHNIGITHISANTVKDGLSILVTIKNFSSEEKELPLYIYLDKETKKELQVKLPPKMDQTVVINDLTPITPSLIEARLKIDDDLMADNRAFLTPLPKNNKVKICVAGKKSNNIEKILKAIDFVDYTYLAEEPKSNLDYNIYIFNNLVPSSGTSFSKLVILNPPADFYPFIVKKLSVITNVTYSDTASQILKEVDMSGFHIWQSKGISIAPEEKEYFTPLLSSGDYILLGEWEKEGKHLIVSGINMDWLGPKDSDTDWALTPCFPIFWLNLINYLSDKKKQPQSIYGYYKIGELKQLDPVVEKSGVYNINTQGNVIPVALNVCNAQASDNNGVSNILDFTWNSRNTQPKISETIVPLTSWLILAGLILLILSWWLDKNK
jgi:hypothetical protein